MANLTGKTDAARNNILQIHNNAIVSRWPERSSLEIMAGMKSRTTENAARSQFLDLRPFHFNPMRCIANNFPLQMPAAPIPGKAILSNSLSGSSSNFPMRSCLLEGCGGNCGLEQVDLARARGGRVLIDEMRHAAWQEAVAAGSRRSVGPFREDSHIETGHLAHVSDVEHSPAQGEWIPVLPHW